MTIILFLVDTSASMCQKAYANGVHKSYLDIAKGAVETFLKFRQRTQDCLGDRYMLLTFDDPPNHVKAGWKENHATFMNELKNLQSMGLTPMGEALRNAFDLLNLNRMQSGIDTYGQGRCPFYLEPSVIIVITDGGRYSYRNGVFQDIILPISTQIPGTKFTKEPFRWDQRLFSLVLRIPGTKIEDRIEAKVPYDDSPIERMCEVTGGRSYRVRSHYQLNQCIESLVQKVQPGVVLQFEPYLPKEVANGNVFCDTHSHDIIFQPTKKMIYVPKHISQKTFPIGHWPLPEPYWPDSKAVTLPPRDAHPRLKIVTPAGEEPQLVRGFPVDKYEVEPSPMTLQILNRRESTKCWQVIVSNGVHGFDLPFGYLKASQNFTQVHLYVLAYNYPALMPLLHDLVHKYNMNPHPHQEVMYKFNAYVRSIPAYYYPFLRKALVSINVPYQMLPLFLPEGDNYLPQAIASQLKHIKNTAKVDQENLCLKVHKQLKQPKPPYRPVETAKICSGSSTRRDLVRHPFLRESFTKLHSDIEPIESHTMLVPQAVQQPSAKSYRNPFDITRRDLVTDIARMRESFLRTGPISLVAKDAGHCLPVSEMGNYQEYLKNKDNPLREIEPTNVRQHMFGNPYKKDKHMVMVDEADLGEVAPVKVNGHMSVQSMGLPGMIIGGSKKTEYPRPRKRRAGPLPQHFIWRFNSNKSSTDSTSSDETASIESDSDSDASSICSDGHNSLKSEKADKFVFREDESNDSDSTTNGFSPSFISSERDTKCFEKSISSTISSTTTISEHLKQQTRLPSTTSPGVSTTVISGVTTTHVSSAITVTPPIAAVTAPTTNLTNLTNFPHSTTDIPEKKPYIAATPINGLSKAVYAGYAALSLPKSDTIQTTKGIKPVINGFSNHHLTISNQNHTNTTSAVSLLSPTVTSTVASLALPTVSIPTATVTVAATTITSPTSATTTMPMYYTHSDINDASEISRILQTCHSLNNSGGASSASTLGISIGVGSCSSGGSSSSSSSSSNSNHNSNNNSSNTNHNNDSTSNDIVTNINSKCSSNSLTSSSIISPFSNFSPTTITATTNSFDSLKNEHKVNGATSPPIVSSAFQQLQNNHYNYSNNNNNNNSNSNSNDSINSSSNSNVNSPSHNLRSNALRKINPLTLTAIAPFPATAATPTAMATAAAAAATITTTLTATATAAITTPTTTMMMMTTTTTTTTIPANDFVFAVPDVATIKTERHASASPSILLLLNDEERAEAIKHNRELRLKIWTEIRRPGRNYSRLIDQLTHIKGDYDIKSAFISRIIDEIEHFRRHQMSKAVKNWWTIQNGGGARGGQLLRTATLTSTSTSPSSIQS